MNVLTGLRGLSRRSALGVIAATLAPAALVASVYGYERAALWASRRRTGAHPGPPQPFVQNENRGLLRPPASRAEGSGMRDDDEVIGVEAGGRSRAYRLEALRDRTRHVVNDLVGGVPVSVAYCDLNGCVRGYTDPRGSAPLDVGVGGLYVDNGPEMVVKVDGRYYFHKSGKPMEPGPGPAAVPYDTFVPAQTTWKDWLRAHPATDVYAGDRK